MELINKLDSINKNLAEAIEQDEYTSIGYIPINNSITAHDIITIKKAQKLLDIIIVQNVSNINFDEFTLSALSQLNPQIAIDCLDEPEEHKLHINFASQEINSLSMIRAILSILPSSVFTNSNNFEIFKACQVLNNTFKDLFTLQDVSTPESIMSFNELEVIKLLQKLDKSNKAVTKEVISHCLADFTISNYQEFKINNNLFVNLTILSNNDVLNVSYTFVDR